MQRFSQFLLLGVAAASLASCYGPEPRPFAGRGRSLDEPPRYGDPNRYVDPVPNGPMDAPAGPPVPPAPNLDPAAGAVTPGVDPGLTVTPPVPGGVQTPPVVTQPPSMNPEAPAPAPKPSSVPFARAVPGKPGFVYSPKDPNKMISVEGLRPGQTAKDPETGDMFKVPFQ